MTEEQQDELQKIKDECNLFHEQMTRRISELCNVMEYHDGSLFSYNIDRLNLFINELNEFEMKGN